MTFWRRTARKRRNFGPLGAVKRDWTPRTWGIVEETQPVGVVLVTPHADRGVVDVQPFRHRREGITGMEAQEGHGPFAGTSLEGSFRQQFRQGLPIRIRER